MEMKPNKLNIILSLIFFLMFVPFLKIEGKFATLLMFFASKAPKIDYLSFFILFLGITLCYLLSCTFLHVYRQGMSGKLFKR